MTHWQDDWGYQLCARCNGETADVDMVDDVCKGCAGRERDGLEADLRFIRKTNDDTPEIWR